LAGIGFAHVAVHFSKANAMSDTAALARTRLRVSFGLDRLWAESIGMPAGDTKERPLRLVAQVLERSGTPYALIGGLAVQLRTAEPRTTLDIHVAVASFDQVPCAALLAAGFEHTGRHAHSDNWLAPAGNGVGSRVAVQFSAEDVGIAAAVAAAEMTEVADGLRLRVATAADLIQLKLAAAAEPQRRPSKRQHDVADVVALLEEHPHLGSAEILTRLRAVRLALLDS
jgi:hypothetical protein